MTKSITRALGVVVLIVAGCSGAGAGAGEPSQATGISRPATATTAPGISRPAATPEPSVQPAAVVTPPPAPTAAPAPLLRRHACRVRHPGRLRGALPALREVRRRARLLQGRGYPGSRRWRRDVRPAGQCHQGRVRHLGRHGLPALRRRPGPRGGHRRLRRDLHRALFTYESVMGGDITIPLVDVTVDNQSFLRVID